MLDKFNFKKRSADRTEILREGDRGRHLEAEGDRWRLRGIEDDRGRQKLLDPCSDRDRYGERQTPTAHPDKERHLER